MEIKFRADIHKYESIDNLHTKWISATSLVNLFKKPFDAERISISVSKKKKSKWYGMKPEDIREIWKKEANRATSLGTWYHNERETELLACSTLQREGLDLSVIHPIEQDGIKLSPNQTIVPGIYPEHLVYLKSARICGQADRLEVVNNRVDIFDYKTNKEIKKRSLCKLGR